MTTEEVKVVYSIEDNLTPGVQKMADSEASFRAGLESTRNTLAAVSAAATGLAIAGVAAISELTSVYEVQAQAEAQLEQRIKSTGGAAGLTAEQLKDMASGLQSVTTYGDEAIIGAESLLLTFTKIGGDVFPKALETVLDMSTAMGQDLKSSAIQLGKALNDPIAGIGALSRVGVQFSEEQKTVIEQLVKTGDVAAAQSVIIRELETQMGGAARATAQTFGGALTQITNIFGDMEESVGKAISETLTPFVQWIASTLPYIQEFVSENANLIAGMITFGTVGAGLTAVVTGLGAALATLALSWVAIQTAFATTAAFVTTVLGPALLAIAPWVAGIGAAIAGVIVFWDELKFVTQAAAGAIQLVVTSLVEGIRYLFEDIATYIHDEWPMAFEIITTITELISISFNDMKVAVLDIFDDIAEAASWLAEKLDPIIEAIKVIAGSDLYEDRTGEKMTGKTSVTTKTKSTTQTSFASAFGESLAANPSKAFDTWAETSQGQGMLREDPVGFYTLKNASEQATGYTAPTTSTSYRTEAENAALEVARAQDVSLWQKQYGSNGGTVSLDSTSVTALASALSTNGATYQKTRYAY